MPKWSRIRSANTRGFDVATQSVYRVACRPIPVVSPVSVRTGEISVTPGFTASLVTDR